MSRRNTATRIAEHRQRILDCPDCDHHGWRIDHGGRDGDLPKRCDHHPRDDRWVAP